MPQNLSPRVPSQTALFTALRRAIAHMHYRNESFGPDHLAEIFLPGYYRLFLKSPAVRENTRQRLAASMPGLTEYVIARTAHFDRLFREALLEGVPQIVLLGAGYDSRAYRFEPSNRGTRIFELDTAPTQRVKLKRLGAARIAIPDGVTFVPVDFSSQDLGEALQSAGFQPAQRALFLWEGGCYYLEEAAVRETLDSITRIACTGSALHFDYAEKIGGENLSEVYGAAGFQQSMAEHHPGEGFLFTLEPGGLEPLLAEVGLRLVEHLDSAAISARYLRDEKGELIGRMAGGFAFAGAAVDR